MTMSSSPRAPQKSRARRWVACAAWALWPLPNVKPSAVSLAQPDRSNPRQDQAEPFPIAVFDAALWVEPPAPIVAEAPKPEPPPPPVRLSLIGIVRQTPDGPLHAAIYDPDTDELRVVRDGDTLGRVTVDRVTEQAVTLLADGRPRTLALDTAGGTP